MYIHQIEEWPCFKWDTGLIGAKLAKVNKASGFLEGRLAAIGFDAMQHASVEALTHDIMSSSEIEGVVLNSDQVRSSVARKMGVSIIGEVDSSHYVDGIVEMMLDATAKFDEPLTNERLFGWHNCLFPTGRSGLEVIDVGKYRSCPMRVVSGQMGREKIHYAAPEAEIIPKEMSKFLAWFNADFTPKDYVKSAVAHFWFVCIHPFDDGNGRMGRAITDMALSQADNSPMRYFSMSRQINKEKTKYYNILERSQKGTCDITAWIDWYLDCMLRAVGNADEMLSSILDKSIFWQTHSRVVLNNRQNKVLNTYLDGFSGKLTVKNWARHSKVSVDTAERDIKYLIENGVLLPEEGKVRNISYGIIISKDKVYVPGPAEDGV